MRLQIDGLNLHYKFSIKKPFGGGSSFVQDIIKHPGYALAAPVTGGLSLLGNAVGEHNTTTGNSGVHNATGPDMTGLNDQSMIQGQYNQLADKYGADAVPLRAKLASSLQNYAQNTFQQENPFILQDLNARGLASSPTAVANSQSQELGRLVTANTQELNNFDTDVFNQTQNLRTTGAATGLQRLFDVTDQTTQNNLAQSLARRQRQNQLLGAGIGAVGQIGSSALRSL